MSLTKRVVSQRRFAVPEYQELDAGKPIHVEVESAEAHLRRVSEVAAAASLVRYNGGSLRSGRGAVMALNGMDGGIFPGMPAGY